MILRIRLEGSDEEFDMELTDEQWAVLQAVCDRDGITVEQAVNRAVDEFLASHPIIRQTRIPQ